ncbi:hypothetical protein FRC01_002833 [Tulasnella sp. 417]|nr:hypothetical protein FRC01_002833 [Tulasnella sp. 417]
MLQELTLWFQSFSLRNIPAWAAERSQRLDIVELPNLRTFHLDVEVDVGIFLLRHIAGPSCNHLNLSFPCGGTLSPITELRQALTGFAPCIQNAVEASSRTRASVAVSDSKGQTVVMRTDHDASHTFSLTLSFASKWLTEIFQWLGDLVSPFPQDNPFVWIFLMTRPGTPTSRPIAPSELERWIQTTALMRNVHTLDLGRLYHANGGIFELLSEPIDEEEPPRWPLASLNRLAIREELDHPLRLLKFLQDRSGNNPESSYLTLPVRLAELVVLVEGRSHSEEWVPHIPAIEEALQPGQLTVKYLNDDD